MLFQLTSGVYIDILPNTAVMLVNKQSNIDAYDLMIKLTKACRQTQKCENDMVNDTAKIYQAVTDICDVNQQSEAEFPLSTDSGIFKCEAKNAQFACDASSWQHAETTDCHSHQGKDSVCDCHTHIPVQNAESLNPLLPKQSGRSWNPYNLPIYNKKLITHCPNCGKKRLMSKADYVGFLASKPKLGSPFCCKACKKAYGRKLKKAQEERERTEKLSAQEAFKIRFATAFIDNPLEYQCPICKRIFRLTEEQHAARLRKLRKKPDMAGPFCSRKCVHEYVKALVRLRENQ